MSEAKIHQNAWSSLRKALDEPCPWLDSLRPLLEKTIESDARSFADTLNRLRTEVSGVSFVAHEELPVKEPYESFIARTCCVPTRDNFHDLFNGLVWLAFPKSKRRINELQASEIAARGVAGSRGAVRDALTLFDENGAVLRAPPELIDALRNRDWDRLFVSRRTLWASSRLVLFGHALLEKLLRPRKCITAHVWVLDDLSDDSLAASLDGGRLAVAKPFLPLPVLGVPGWSSENERAKFYDDAAVFRPAR